MLKKNPLLHGFLTERRRNERNKFIYYEDIIYLDCIIVLLFWPFLHGLGMTEYLEYQFPRSTILLFSSKAKSFPKERSSPYSG